MEKETYHLAQLRHLYKHLVEGTFTDSAKLADGLLAPAIRFLETKDKVD
jgi:hypothetical protein